MTRYFHRAMALLLCLSLCLCLLPTVSAEEIEALEDEAPIQEIAEKAAESIVAEESAEPEEEPLPVETAPTDAEAAQYEAAPETDAPLEPEDAEEEEEPLPEPVEIEFYMEEAELLVCLSVTDAYGQTLDPVTDPDTGAFRYGVYLLLPGEYVYRFHDESGDYADLEESFAVGAYEWQLITVEPEPVFEVFSYSVTYINPIYEDVITEADIPDSPYSQEERIALLRDLAEAEEGGGRRGNRKYQRDSAIYTDLEAAGLDLRAQIGEFETTATIHLQLSGRPTQEYCNQLIYDIATIAYRHTGVPTEGDYLRYEFGGFKCKANAFYNEKKYYCDLVYTLNYFTSAEQEAALTPVVQSIVRSLSLSGKNDFQKALAVYQYICDHVRYGGSGNLKFTAYSALVNNLAYCQGYSAAFYRLCLEAGVDARMITSGDMNHAWNIVRMDGQYYELDATFDEGYKPANYRFYLRGSEYWLENHHFSGSTLSVIGDEFNDSAFAAAYPLPAQDYIPTITMQPASVSVYVGGTVTFATQAINGDQYQWQTRTYDAAEWTDVPNAAGRAITLTPTLEDSGRSYRCEISNNAGSVYTEAVELTVKNYTYSMSLNLAESIGINFFVYGAESYDGLTISWIKKDGSTATRNVTDGTPVTVNNTPEGKGYAFQLESLAAKEMTVPIPVTVRDANGNTLKETRCSVKSYCDLVLARDTASAALKELCRAALVYGSTAQARFGYNTEDLAEPDYADYLVKSVPKTADTAVVMSEPAGGITGVGLALNLISRTDMKICLVHEEGTKFSDYHFSVTKDGEPYNDFTVSNTDEYYTVIVRGVCARDLATRFTVSAQKGDEVYTVSATPLAYSRLQQNDPIEGDVSRGVYQYAMAARAYAAANG